MSLNSIITLFFTCSMQYLSHILLYLVSSMLAVSICIPLRILIYTSGCRPQLADYRPLENEDRRVVLRFLGRSWFLLNQVCYKWLPSAFDHDPRCIPFPRCFLLPALLKYLISRPCIRLIHDPNLKSFTYYKFTIRRGRVRDTNSSFHPHNPIAFQTSL